MTTVDPQADSRAARRAKQAEALSHIGTWEWTLADNSVWWSDELYRIYGLEPGSVAITFESFLERVHPEDRPVTVRATREALERGGRFGYLERILRPDGSIRRLDTVGEVLLGPDGAPCGLMGTCRDITEKWQAEQVTATEQQILEEVLSGTPLPDILRRIVVLIEQQAPNTRASILLLEPDGLHIRHGASVSLPDTFVKGVDGAAIGPKAGSCGTAAYLRKPVVVSDLRTDPLWEDWRELALSAGLVGCWSTPFLSKEGWVMGTFALYPNEPRGPTPEEERLITRFTHLTAVAVENRMLERQLRALSERLESVREDERTAIAREIHDELGQALTGLKLDLAWLGRRVVATPPASVDQVVQQVQQLTATADELLSQVQKISAELRPGILDDLGLTAAIEWQAREFERRTGTACSVQSTMEEETLQRPLATAVFRIFQEALTNVSRHAQADRVDVLLDHRAGQVLLQVEDDGIGIPTEALASPRSLGLLGIRERALRLGGVASVRRGPLGGTLLQLSLPLQESLAAR